ncbi:unnamed protein product, partial [Staurois parvus]
RSSCFNPRFTSVRVVLLRVCTKICAATPPTQRNADPRAGSITSNDTPPALENATILGTEVPVQAAFSKEVQGLLPCVSQGTGVHSNKWALVSQGRTDHLET